MGSWKNEKIIKGYREMYSQGGSRGEII